MKFSIDKKELYVLFQLLEDKLTTLNTADVKTQLVLLNTEGFRNIILDLSVVDFVDSSGLSAILVAHRICKDAEGTLVLAGAHENVKKLIQISQLSSVLNLMPTVQESIDFVMMDELTRQITAEE